ncbi:hypothetical protein [Rhizobium lentis]|uniref:hypothetical protein n=1 Tax=Rhizobium lentis TaxID=1138194 RepID=UPI001C8300F5|nr:hypothetical protein [Rhizobium lentis]MBX5008153.1 hypothetical protein [Rhizobium lentis]
MADQNHLPGFKPASPETEETFDWRGPEVIIRTQPATAIYRNVHDAVVIRQESVTGYDDQFVFFATKDDVQTLINALDREIAGAK